MKAIIDLIEIKEQTHRNKYKEFCEKNPGYIMNGHLIKADTCKEILDLIDLEFNGIHMIKNQPKEGDKILAKLSMSTKPVAITITGNVWDYGIIKWKINNDTK